MYSMEFKQRLKNKVVVRKHLGKCTFEIEPIWEEK